MKSLDSNDDKRNSLEERLIAIKEFDLNRLVVTCLKKLGLRNETESRKDCNVNEDENVTEEKQEHNRIVLDLMMQHKKIIDLLKQLTEKINKSHERKMKSYGEGDSGNQRQQKVMEYSAASGVFLDSLAGGGLTFSAQNESNLIERDEYGYDINDEYAQISKPAKKNRKGQRARRAKAMALEAKREGKIYKSINWRPKKSNDDMNDEANINASGLGKEMEVKAADVAEMGKDWKNDGKAHPSWAAKEHAKKQSGIAAFAGKKIIFD